MKKPRLLAPAAQQLLLLFEIVAAASDCGDGSATTTITIANSGDASSLASACATIEASVSIGAGAGGDIELDGVQVIRGELQVESCSALGCDEETTTRISSSTLELVDGDVNIANLSGLQNLSFPALGEVKGQFSVHDLDSLDTLNLSALSSVGNLTISNVRQLYYLKLGIAQANKVSVTGNKQLVLQLDGTTTSDDTNSGLVSYLDISRIGELRWGASNGGIVVGNLAVHDTGITELPLLFSSVQSLDVWNNEDLTEVLFPADENAQTRLFSQLKQISIGNNEKFNMTTIRSVEWNSTDMLSWVWPSENLDSVVLDGIIHIAFL
ncbi:hypothetical protein TruAng_007813 [Truncatella angustata]|nr:hypothetical protein TruAng_007813 [Truncatella angustata]